MANQDTKIGSEYHNATKHSYWSIRRNAHYLDWQDQPYPFKVSTNLEPIPLPRDLPHSGVPAIEAVAATRVEAQGDVVPDLPTLAHVLYYSAGITKKKTYPGGEIYFRAAACAGALYPIEIYVVCGDLPGLEAGVYHFNPGDFALCRLRAGDYRGILVQATANEPSIAAAPVVLVHTAITWRSSWKYQARSYRYHYWDDGMNLANTLAASAANKLPTKIVMGFVDDLVNRLVGVDGEQEMSLALAPLGHLSAPPPAPVSEISDLRLEVRPLSRRQVDYPIIRKMHKASSLATVDEVTAWQGASPDLPTLARTGRVVELHPLDASKLPGEELESVIVRRASTRQFAHKSIPFESLSTLLDRATRGFPTDFLEPPGWHLNDLYLSVHAVEGLPPGTYFYHWSDRTLELLKEGDFRQKACYLCLEQDLGGDSSFTVFYLADLERIFQRYGNRGYRAAQMEAAIIGGKLYLTAYALRHGATGLTFYDDDVTNFFSPHAQGKSAMFVTALGAPGRRP
ncbi:MAG: SagB/ThcOx family dehydrogenase [Acidobacteria bacterium]|nr:SagB/ThcOx family dehydrogenase [Acidobacteriota bacterium]